MSNQKPSQFFPIQILNVVAPAGSVRTTSVPCPERAAPVPIETCQRCAQLDAISVGHAPFVACRPPSTASPPPAWTPISAVMTSDVVCVPRELGIEALMAVFLDRSIGALPVVDDDGAPIGVVSKTDLLRHHYENLDGDAVEQRPLWDAAELEQDGLHVAPLRSARVEDLMTPLAQTVRESDPIARAAALMAQRRIHHLPVVASNGRVVGMLSTFDFARWLGRDCMPLAASGAKRILIIDGNPIASAALAELLKEERYEVETAPSSEAGVRALSGFAADVILADLELSAAEVSAIKRAAGRARHVPTVIWMAARHSPTATPQLTKPIAISDLLRTIEHALGRRERE
jgi:CBS domain-containing protein